MAFEGAQGSHTVRALRAGGWALGFGLCVRLFYDARELNSGFLFPRKGIMSVPESELVYYVWYALYGTLATICLARMLSELRAQRVLAQAFATALDRPVAWVRCIALLSFAASIGFRHLVLLGQAVTDDEATYVFIARTLLAGRVTNPPPEDPELFMNQFVVLNAHGWHGKYPIGHSLVLALGEAVGAIDWMMPLAGALAVLLTYRAGSKLFDPRVALLGATLLLLSPHFIWTNATLLSQPTLCVALLAGMALLLHMSDTQRLHWAALAGCVFGFGVLVRPLPGGPFALMAALYCVVDGRRNALAARAIFGRLALFGLGALPWLLVFMAVNHAQSGSVLTSGYQDYHGPIKLLYNNKGQVTNSLGGALIRENFWLFGWTFALVLVPFSRPARAALLLWGILLAELAYRVIAPKTVVAVTGPIYLSEIVPLLSLMAADALLRIGRFFSDARVRPSEVVVAATITALCMFVPLQIGALLTGAEARLVLSDKLQEAGAERALIFTNAFVDPSTRVTWAYFPDNPSPDLSDDWLYLRIPRGDDAPARILDTWQRDYPDRRAFLFTATPEPALRELGRDSR